MSTSYLRGRMILSASDPHSHSMRTAIFIMPLCLACVSGQEQPRQEDPPPRIQVDETAKGTALAALKAEPKILDVAWEGSSLWAGVKDDGTRRDGYAGYLCEVVREHGATPVVIHVKDISSGKTLGRSDCR